MSKPLPFQWLQGADNPNSLAQQVQANFDALATQNALFADQQTDWQIPTFYNGWTEYDPTNEPVRYRVFHGTLEFKGSITGGLSATNAQMLSTPMLPEQRSILLLGGDNGVGAVSGLVRVDTDGVLRQVYSFPTTVYVALAALRVPLS